MLCVSHQAQVITATTIVYGQHPELASLSCM
jgi:hypothetical protein